MSNVGTLQATLTRAGCLVTYHRYSGTGHWFFEPDVLQSKVFLLWHPKETVQ